MASGHNFAFDTTAKERNGDGLVSNPDMTAKGYNTTITVAQNRSKQYTGVYNPEVPESKVGPVDDVKDNTPTCNSN